MKASFLLILFNYLLLVSTFCHGGSTSGSGGYMLMMTSETQKEAERRVGYVEEDMQELYSQLNQLLYVKVRKRMVKRKDIKLENNTKESIMQVSKRLADNFDKLSNSFKSIYFVDATDDSYKKYFDSIKTYRQDLKGLPAEINIELLYDLHAQSQKVELSVGQIRSIIKGARITTEAYIQEKLHKMSVWQWLFGY